MFTFAASITLPSVPRRFTETLRGQIQVGVYANILSDVAFQI